MMIMMRKDDNDDNDVEAKKGKMMIGKGIISFHSTRLSSQAHFTFHAYDRRMLKNVI